MSQPNDDYTDLPEPYASDLLKNYTDEIATLRKEKADLLNALLLNQKAMIALVKNLPNNENLADMTVELDLCNEAADVANAVLAKVSRGGKC